MDIIANYWWLWLLSLVLSIGYVMINQVRRMKAMMNAVDSKSSNQSFFSGLGSFVAAGLVASASALLLVISLIVNLLEYLH